MTKAKDSHGPVKPDGEVSTGPNLTALAMNAHPLSQDASLRRAYETGAAINAETIATQQAEIRRLEGLIARLIERGSNLIYPTTPVLLTEAWWHIVKASSPPERTAR